MRPGYTALLDWNAPMSRDDPKTGPRWYVLRAGTETGPYASRELRAMARAGELAPGDYVNVRPSSPGTARRADTVPGLFPAAAVPAEPAPIPLVEAEIVDDEDDVEEPVPERRSRKKQPLLRTRTLVLSPRVQVVGMSIAAVVVVVGVVLAAWPGARGTSSPLAVLAAGEDGPDWTYLELLQHLRSNGIVGLEMIGYGDGQLYAQAFPNEMRGIADYLKSIGHEGSRFQFVASKMASAKEARELAGRTETRAFAWGRWVFLGKPETLATVKKALTEKVNVPDTRVRIGPAVNP